MSNYIEYNDKIAFHPGYYIKEIIEESGLSQKDFAKRLDTTPKNLSILVRGEQSLSIDIAMKLSRMLGTSVDYWLNLQKSYDALIAEFESSKELEQERRIFKYFQYTYFRENFGLPDLPRKTNEQIKCLREFLNVASLSVFTKQNMAVSFRSASEDMKEANIARANAMVQIAINQALKIEAPKFEKKKFEQLDEKTKEEFKARFDKLGEIRKELSTLVDKDTESFNEFMKAVKMPKETEEQNKLRAKAIQEATIFSIEVPYKTASLSLEALRLLDFLIKNGNQNAITDIGVGTLMLSAGMEGAILNVKVNLGQIKDKQIYDKYRDGCKEILSEGNEIKDNIISNIHKQLD